MSTPKIELIGVKKRFGTKQVLDGVHIHLDDGVGFERECRQGQALGFDGKTLIHPKTIDVANSVFSPTAAAIERAEQIIRAYKEAGEGVTVLNGRLVEALHVRRALALIDLAARVQQKQGVSAA